MKAVRVGVGVMIVKDDKILLGRRHADPEKADSELEGAGTWTMPGGKVDFHEELEDSARREVKEETGIAVNRMSLISVTSDKVPENHFVTIGFLAESFDGDPHVMEPDEIVEWRWFPFTDLPTPLFPPSEKIIKNYRDKTVFKH